jgi:transcriptional regulator GlxA family with amidase domain
MPKTRTVAVLAMPNVQLLDVAGPLDVFAEANVQAQKTVYELRVLSTRAGPIDCSSGTRLLADATIQRWRGAIDTLLVAGAPNLASAGVAAGTADWLRRAAPAARRYGSVCSGAFALGAAGLLNGRRVTTHWAVADELARVFPAATVEPDAIYLRDGKLRTAAGVTAGLDLALALVEEDLGRDIAMAVSSQLVMYFKRPGGQAQFIRRDEVAPAGRSVLQELQRWIAANPAADHSVANLAVRVGVSPRHLTRLFRHEVGTTPAAWVEEARVAAVRRLLERGDVAPKQAAFECGFSSADTLRRVFVQRLGVTPAEYRRRHAAR